MVKDAKERMMFCPECHLMEYPKISPAVIIAVTDGNRILMSKYAGGNIRNTPFWQDSTRSGRP